MPYSGHFSPGGGGGGGCHNYRHSLFNNVEKLSYEKKFL